MLLCTITFSKALFKESKYCLLIPLYSTLKVANIMEKPEILGCLGTVCENGTRNTAIWNLLIWWKSGIYKRKKKKKSLAKIQDFISHLCKHICSYQSFIFFKFFRININGEQSSHATTAFCHCPTLLFHRRFCHSSSLLVCNPKEAQSLS